MRLALLALPIAAAAACSPASGGASDGGASNDDGGPTMTPDGFVSATVGVGSSSPTCSVASDTDWLTVGVDTSGKPSTVESGHDGVTMTCSVRAVGNGYDISASVTAAGNAGGTFTLTSPPGAGAVSVLGGQGLTASFGNTVAAATYQSSDCVLSFTYEGAPITDSPSVFPGRIWGHVSCPAAQASMSMTCDAEADFLVEQCDE